MTVSAIQTLVSVKPKIAVAGPMQVSAKLMTASATQMLASVKLKIVSTGQTLVSAKLMMAAVRPMLVSARPLLVSAQQRQVSAKVMKASALLEEASTPMSQVEIARLMRAFRSYQRQAPQAYQSSLQR